MSRKIKPRQHFRQSIILRNFLKQKYNKNVRILDAGAGNGVFIKRLKALGYTNVAGVDMYPQLKEIKKGDVCKLPFKNASFDVVFSGDVLEHIKDDNKAVKEMFRVLKKGGMAFVSVAFNPHLYKMIDFQVGHFRRYTKKRFFDIVTNNGFEINHSHYWGFPLLRLYNKIQNWVTCRKFDEVKKERQELYKAGAPYCTHYVFYFDNLFNWLPLGIGLNAVLKKR